MAGGVAVLVGIGALVFADAYKPTIENALANGGNVLKPSTYHAVQAFGWICIVGGAIAAIVGFIQMQNRRAGPLPQGQTVQPPPQAAPSKPPDQKAAGEKGGTVKKSATKTRSRSAAKATRPSKPAKKSKVFCEQCGVALEPDDHFCGECGHEQPVNA